METASSWLSVKDKKAYGRTKFGTFRIRLNDLKKMIIEPALQKKS
jgi:hypothetical protein